MHELLKHQLELATGPGSDKPDLETLLSQVSRSYTKLEQASTLARGEIKQTRAQSDGNRTLLELIVNNVKDTVLTVDRFGAIESFNSTGEQMFGYKVSDVLGRPLSKLIPPAGDMPIDMFLDSHSTTVTCTHADLAAQESLAVHADGSLFPIEISVSEAALGSRAMYVVGIRDITQRKDAERALRESERRYRGLFENVVDGVYQTSVEGTLISANPALVRMLGFSSLKELKKFPNPEALYLVPEERQLLFRMLKRKGAVQNFEYKIRLRDGTIRVVIENARAVKDHRDRVVSYEGTVRDVTERRRAESAAQQERERALVTLRSISDAVVTADADGNVDYMNPAAENITGWELRAARGRPAAEIFQVVHQDSTEVLESPLVRCLREGRPLNMSLRGIILNKAGDPAASYESASPIRDRDGGIIGAVMVFRDITLDDGLRRQLSYQASHDQLTMLLNRHEFQHRLADAIQEAHDRPGLCHALLYLDLDQFKLANDMFGHAAGDVLLKKVTNQIKAGVRSDDVLARLGGDEFGILLHGCTVEQAVLVAEGLRKSIKGLRFTWEGNSLNVAASIGVVELDHSMPGPAVALSAADVACFAAKEAGRNRIHVYGSEADTSSAGDRLQEMRWVSRINDALDEDRFELFYQPIVPIGENNDRHGHYELLLRMRGEDGEVIEPGAFIPAAERYNLMPMLDRWVVRTALSKLASLDAQGERAGYSLAINLSGTSLNDPAFLDDLVQELSAHKLPKGALCFEITETAAIANLANVARFMHKLKALGCTFSLDDFGSGLSSFAYLRDLPVDFLKIDGHFITNVADCTIDQSMVDAITRVGIAMGIKTIAERVESKVVMDMLASLGVHYAQGYYIARPESVNSFSRFENGGRPKLQLA
ncbi:MAG: EAL domain-containing protein [Gammaproteobacteria bacterium]|nr:EAL domain-containing protein [Gammaproteobacteria bacterium]